MTSLRLNFETYPEAPGWKGTDTSREAGQTVDAETLRELVLAQVAKCDGTADEIATALGVDRLAIRPRCSELKRLGQIRDSRQRRSNVSGKRAIVWTAKG